MLPDPEVDDGIDPHTAPTLEQAIERILAAKLREKFPGLGLSARAAAALATATAPPTETVIELVRDPVGLALIPRPAPKKLEEAPPPRSTRRVRRRYQTS